MEPSSLSCRQYVALEHGTCLHSCRVGDISSHFFTCFHGFGWSFLTSPLLISSSPWPLIRWCQILPKPLFVPLYVQEKLTSVNINLPLVLIWSWFTTKTSCSSVSCRWCGKRYGPPSIKVTSCRLQLIIQEADLETPLWYLGACMPQWQVRRIRRGVFIIGPRSSDSTGVRRQLIDSHAVDCTCSTLRAIVIIGGSSRVC